MKEPDYSSINTLIDVHSEYLLTPTIYQELLHAKDEITIETLLQDSPYMISMSDLKDSRLIEKRLMKQLVDDYRFVYQETPEPPLVDIFGAKYMYHNLKVLMKEEALDIDLEDLLIPIGRYSMGELRHVVQTGESRIIHPRIVKWINQAREEYQTYHSTEAIDIGLDMAYFDHLNEVSTLYGDEQTDAVVRPQIEFYNVITLLRALNQKQTYSMMIELYTDQGILSIDQYLKLIEERHLLQWFNEFNRLPYQNYFSETIEQMDQEQYHIATLEKLEDEYLIKFFEEYRLTYHRSLTLLEYLYRREIEVKNLRLILVGRLNGISPQAIEERMRLFHG